MKVLFPNGIPKIILTHEVYEWCLGWMEATSDEVSWRGLADWNEREFRVTEVFLPIQKASGAHVEVPTAQEGGDFGKWLTDSIRAGTYQNEKGECRYKWHMHKHPGQDWGSLFESTTDENNTAKFGVSDIKWMMVGRAVGGTTGKFRVCLEIFAPFRISIDYLPVFVEYNGALVKISEPGKNLTVEGLVSPKLSNDDLLLQITDGKKYFGAVSVEEKEETIYSYPYASGYGYGKSYQYGGYQTVTLKKKRELIIQSISEFCSDSGITCILEKTDGIVTAGLEFMIGSWEMKINNIYFQIPVSIIPAIREKAKLQVTEKVSAAYVVPVYQPSLYTPKPWQKQPKKKGKIKTTSFVKTEKEVKEDGCAEKPVQRFSEPGPGESQFPDHDNWGRRDW